MLMPSGWWANAKIFFPFDVLLKSKYVHNFAFSKTYQTTIDGRKNLFYCKWKHPVMLHENLVLKFDGRIDVNWNEQKFQSIMKKNCEYEYEHGVACGRGKTMGMKITGI